MSHIDSGFCITNIAVLDQIIQETCPTLELVKQKNYRTWVTDHGGLAGDYPLPAMYQLILLNNLRASGVDIWALCRDAGYVLPEGDEWINMEKTPWGIEVQRKLMQNLAFQEAYRNLEKNVLSQDAEYVIRHKTDRRCYEIGLVPHPIYGHYTMMADWYNSGYGLFHAPGLGGVTTRDGKTEWGNTLKQNYAVTVAEKTIQEGIADGRYLSYTRNMTPAGVVDFDITPC